MNYKTKIKRIKQSFTIESRGGFNLREALKDYQCRVCYEKIRGGELYIKDDYQGYRFHYLCFEIPIKRFIKSYNKYKSKIKQINIDAITIKNI